MDKANGKTPSDLFIAKTWAQRAQAEKGAQIRFQALKQDFLKHQLPTPLIQMVEAAIEDEKKHEVLCSQIARQLGHPTGYENPKRHSDRTSSPLTWKQQESPRDQLLLEVFLMCCLTETINANLVNRLYTSDRKSQTGQVLHQILKDEVKHGQIGWAFLKFESQHRSLSIISKYLVEMLEVSVNDELFLPSNDQVAFHHSVQLGVLNPQLRLNQFKMSFYEVIVPALELFKIEASSAIHWLENKLSLDIPQTR